MDDFSKNKDIKTKYDEFAGLQKDDYIEPYNNLIIIFISGLQNEVKNIFIDIIKNAIIIFFMAFLWRN